MLKGFVRDETGAIAPVVALSLFALIAVGGIAFDYARMAAMDSELQNAADQAALAAATQLDGQGGAIARADSAARNLVHNITRFANEPNSVPAVEILSVDFYSCSAATSACAVDPDENSDAKFVRVTVAPREAFYALTPVVGAISDEMDAAALAGLHEAICKVPPVMICNPLESSDPDFTFNNYIGKGLKLVSVGSGGGAWAPGNYGYLDSHGGSNGAPGLREALGWDAPPGDCSPNTGVDTKPGATVSVTDALNTRFDIYDSNQSCPSGGNCPASINSIKDVVRPNNANSNNGCALHNNGWQLSSNYYGKTVPTSTTPLSSNYPDTMGHPRDICHAVSSGTTGACTGAIGNGAWDRDAYFWVNYGWTSAQWQGFTGLSPSVAPTASNYASRYNVYAWEIEHRGSTIGGKVILASRTASGSGANALIDHDAPVCSPAKGYGGGVIPGGEMVDRRRISVAVINCTANNVHGNSTNVPVQRWMEAFLVEPSVARDRTSAGDLYVEVIGETETEDAGGTAGQVVRKNVPYLVE